MGWGPREWTLGSYSPSCCPCPTGKCAKLLKEVSLGPVCADRRLGPQFLWILGLESGDNRLPGGDPGGWGTRAGLGRERGGTLVPPFRPAGCSGLQVAMLARVLPKWGPWAPSQAPLSHICPPTTYLIPLSQYREI